MEPVAKKANIDMHLLDSNTSSSTAGRSELQNTLSSIFEAASQGNQEAQQAVSQHLAAVDHTEEDGALIVYTSGTTGRPKGLPSVLLA